MNETAAARWIPAGLLMAIVLWGCNNVALKEMVGTWSPLWTGASRFVVAGALLHLWLRWSQRHPKSPAAGLVPPAHTPALQIWIAGAGSLALYTCVCNWALRFIPASHFAIDMATVPVIALLFEPRAGSRAAELRRWGAAGLAFAGVLLLLRPSLAGGGSLFGECLGLVAAWLWVLYSRQCRRLASGWNGAAVTAHTMWRAGIWMLPLSIVEMVLLRAPPTAEARLLVLQAFSITLGGFIPFALWNHALAHWPVSRVSLFGNLIPVATMACAWLVLGETLSPTLGIALGLIFAGVLLGQLRART